MNGLNLLALHAIMTSLLIFYPIIHYLMGGIETPLPQPWDVLKGLKNAPGGNERPSEVSILQEQINGQWMTTFPCSYSNHYPQVLVQIKIWCYCINRFGCFCNFLRIKNLRMCLNPQNMCCCQKHSIFLCLPIIMPYLWLYRLGNKTALVKDQRHSGREPGIHTLIPILIETDFRGIFYQIRI